MIRTLASRAFGLALDVVFPPRCVTCGDWGAFLCEDCVAATPRAEGRRCETCWTVFTGETCPKCAEFPKAFDGMRAAFSYGGASRDAVLKLKFHGMSAIAPVMAGQMASTLGDWSPPIDAIVPVPLGSSRKRKRGYNQAELLAREIGRTSAFEVLTDRVQRKRQTKPQTEQADVAARRRNVEGAFAATGKTLPRSVLLVDDVATTGATLDACANALLEGGANSVYCLAFARDD